MADQKSADDLAKQRAKDKMQAALTGDQQPQSAQSLSPNQAAVETNKKGEAIIKNVRVYSPYKVYYDGPATSISALNETGPFDVLPGHKNFMTLLSAGDIVVRTNRGGEEHITTNNAIMHVSSDEVRVFLDV